MGAALVDGGKSLAESDPEVSEAIDFVEFYARCALDLFQDRSLGAQPRGAVLVVSPWNFPIAIPCGGIAAALAAGNTVLLKPASDTVLPAYLLCEAFWDGGVPREALQLIPCSGRLAGSQLLGRPEVDTVILTGGTETALKMLGDHPRLRLFAETGGKNGTIVTALSDRDQAIKNVLHSPIRGRNAAPLRCSFSRRKSSTIALFETSWSMRSLASASVRSGSSPPRWDH
jgi:RHH-type proline utilization regulon transcriptional repressor/proline dehydrogenase/delta 1-pyrroline-5-carboxylate dehydrogenase